MSIKSNKGVTLVELMVSIAIFGVIAAACMGLLMFATGVNADITGDVVESSRVYQTLDLIKKTVSEASDIKVDAVKRYGQNEDGTQSEEKITELAYITLSNGGVYEWSLQNGTLVFEIGENSVVLLEDIESFNILYPEENDSVKYKYLMIEFTMLSGNKYELTVSCKNG